MELRGMPDLSETLSRKTGISGAQTGKKNEIVIAQR